MSDADIWDVTADVLHRMGLKAMEELASMAYAPARTDDGHLFTDHMRRLTVDVCAELKAAAAAARAPYIDVNRGAHR